MREIDKLEILYNIISRVKELWSCYRRRKFLFFGVIVEGLLKNFKEKFEVIQVEKGRCVVGSGSSRFEGIKINEFDEFLEYIVLWSGWSMGK